MINGCEPKNNEYEFHISGNNVGFKISSPQKGDHYRGNKPGYHSLVFMINGEVEFSYNDFLNRRFSKGMVFLVPQGVDAYATALSDSRMLVLTFNNKLVSICDQLTHQSFSNELISIEYDFKHLDITPMLNEYVNLMEYYIVSDIECRCLHELKQKELMMVLDCNYTKRELLELFYPILGVEIDFRSKVMERCCESISVHELSLEFGMCYTGFLRKFKKEFGESVQGWMLKQKAKRIKLQMSIPGTTIADIIRNFGFSDGPHFARFCRKHYGCTPTEFSQSIKGK